MYSLYKAVSPAHVFFCLCEACYDLSPGVYDWKTQTILGRCKERATTFVQEQKKITFNNVYDPNVQHMR